ncbi:MAG: PD40 domain-containing protein, partial [Bryobacteraceae bacterium]|nr:PD40 domain-containing protein [Bryobacteraceae bacterium]
AAGGPVQTLCEVQNPRGGDWNAEGIIVFSAANRGLLRIPAQGGQPSPVAANGKTPGAWPVFLPGSRRYLYAGPGGILVGDLDSTVRTVLLASRSCPRYAEGPDGEGYLLFGQDSTVMAQRLNAANDELIGGALPVAGHLGTDTVFGRTRFSVSSNGLLVYEPGRRDQVRLTWMDREGKPVEAAGEPADGMLLPQLSPDEKQVAVRQFDGQNRDIWIRDFKNGTTARVTFHPAIEFYPVWSPDQRHLVFCSRREGAYDLYGMRLNGSGQEELLVKTRHDKTPLSWTARRQLLLYTEMNEKTKFDLWVLPMDGARNPSVFLRTSHNEQDGVFSPDGKWVAYASDESGREEIYVQPYPATGAKWQVSKDGGDRPMWRGDGKELYWLDEAATLHASEVSAGAAFQVGVPKRLFETGVRISFERYGVSRDGKRFLIPLPLATDVNRPTAVVENWLSGKMKQQR